MYDYDDFHEHKRSDTVKWFIAFLLIGVLLLGVIANTLYNIRDFKDGKTDTEQTEEAPNTAKLGGAGLTQTGSPEGHYFTESFDNSEFLLLSAGEPVAQADNTVSKTLTATVYPTDAADQSLDWSVSWLNTDSARAGEPVTDYITVEPNPDANYAIVTCHKGFLGDTILVTVTTRAGGFTATCSVTYAGVPTSLEILKNGGETEFDESLISDYYRINCNSEQYWEFQLDNILHSVSGNYGNYVLSMEAFGSLDIQVQSFDANGAHTGTSTKTEQMQVSRVSDVMQYSYFSIPSGFHQYVSAEIEGGRLTVKGMVAPSAYYAQTGNRGGSAIYSFQNYTNGAEPYIRLTVTETGSGVSQSLLIRTRAITTGVSVSPDTLVF